MNTRNVTGTIVSIGTHGYGFLDYGRDRDLFFHLRDVIGGETAFRELKRGDRVRFDLGERDDGRPKAKFVQRA